MAFWDCMPNISLVTPCNLAPILRASGSLAFRFTASIAEGPPSSAVVALAFISRSVLIPSIILFTAAKSLDEFLSEFNLALLSSASFFSLDSLSLSTASVRATILLVF